LKNIKKVYLDFFCKEKENTLLISNIFLIRQLKTTESGILFCLILQAIEGFW